MRLCQNCGKRIEDNQENCAGCGAPATGGLKYINNYDSNNVYDGGVDPRVLWIVAIVGKVLMIASLWTEFIYKEIYGVKIFSISIWEYYDKFEENVILPIFMIIALIASVSLIFIKQYYISSLINVFYTIASFWFLKEVKVSIDLGIGFYLLLIGVMVSGISLGKLHKRVKREKKLKKQAQK